MCKNRFIYFVLIIIVIILGLSSRIFAELLPYIIAKYSGDILWALMVYLVFRFFFIRKSSKFIFLLSLIISYIVEISQLYHTEFIDSIRNTFIGRLVLGQGFLWSDLVCYLFGICMGLFIDRVIIKTNKKIL